MPGEKPLRKMNDSIAKENDKMFEAADAGELIATIRKRRADTDDTIYTVTTETEGWEVYAGNHHEHSLAFILKALGRRIDYIKNIDSYEASYQRYKANCRTEEVLPWAKHERARKEQEWKQNKGKK